MTRTCPACGQTYASDDEFCPLDGNRLVAAKFAATLPPAVPDAAANTPTTRARSMLAKLADCFKGGETQPAAVPPSPLPSHEHDKGWRLAGSAASTPACDAWPLAMDSPSGEIHGVFRRFRTPSLTTAAAYGALSTARSEAGVQLYGFGTADVGGARFDYEITAKPRGQTLRHWLAATPPSPEKAGFLATLLADWLRKLRAAGLNPFAFDPDVLWLDEGEQGLTLASFGAVSTLGETSSPRFRANLANSALLTLPYAAPELVERRIVADNSVVFTLGQIISAALFGEAHEHAFIRNGSLPFAAIGDLRLSRMLMGTLWPKVDGRWSVDDFLAEFDADAPRAEAPSAWASLRPGAASTAFVLAGEAYWLPEDLLAAAASRWDEATRDIDEMLAWLDGTRFAGAVDTLHQDLLQGRSADYVLARLCRLITPQAPLVWHGYSFADRDAERTLVALAQRAMSERSDAPQASADLRRLFEADLRGAFAPAAPTPFSTRRESP